MIQPKQVFLLGLLLVSLNLCAKSSLTLYIDDQIGKDTNNGLQSTQGAGDNGPLKSLALAVAIASQTTNRNSPVTINLDPGRYNLTETVRIEGDWNKLTIQTTPGNPGKPAYLTGAIPWFGPWSKISSNPEERIVQTNLDRGELRDYQSFSTLYDSSGMTLTRARLPSEVNTYYYTEAAPIPGSTPLPSPKPKMDPTFRRVPVVEYLRRHYFPKASDAAFKTWRDQSGDLGLPLIFALKHFNKTELPPETDVAKRSQILQYTANASGYTVQELAHGLPDKRSPKEIATGIADENSKWGKCHPTLSCITLTQARKQSFFFKETIPNEWLTNESGKLGLEIVFLQTFEAQRNHLIRIIDGSQLDSSFAGFNVGILARAGRREFDGWLSDRGYRFYLENRKEMLQADGQWYLDKTAKKLYYRMRSTQRLNGSHINSGNSATPYYLNLPNKYFQSAPLIAIGKAGSPKTSTQAEIPDVKSNNIHLIGLVLTYTDWTLHPTTDYYPGGQAYSEVRGIWEPYLFPAIHSKCDQCHFSWNSFTALGGHGLWLEGAENVVESNNFTKIGASGIILGTMTGVVEQSQAELSGENELFREAKFNRGNIVKNNRLQKIGTLHYEAVGILAHQMKDSHIESNLIEDVASVGIEYNNFLLGRSDEVKATVVKHCWNIMRDKDIQGKPITAYAEYGEDKKRLADIKFFADYPAGMSNSIKKNVVRRAMLHLNDGAGIYVNGAQKLNSAGEITTVIEDNLVTDILGRQHTVNSNLVGIYLDYNSQNYQLRNNAVGRIQRMGILVNNNSGIHIENNLLGPLNLNGPIEENAFAIGIGETRSYDLSGKYGCSWNGAQTIAVIGSDNHYSNNRYSDYRSIPLTAQPPKLGSTLSNEGGNSSYPTNGGVFAAREQMLLAPVQSMATGAYSVPE